METGIALNSSSSLLNSCNRNMIEFLLSLVNSRCPSNQRIALKSFHRKFKVLKMGVPSGDQECVYLKEILSKFGNLINCLTLYDYNEDGCSGDETLKVFGEFCEMTLKKISMHNLYIECFVDIQWIFPLIESIELFEIDNMYRIISHNCLKLQSHLKELKILNCSFKEHVQLLPGDEKYANFFEKSLSDFFKLNNHLETLSIKNSPHFGMWIFETVVKQLKHLKTFEYTNTNLIYADNSDDAYLIMRPLGAIKTLKSLILDCNNMDIYDLLTQFLSNNVSLELLNLQNLSINWNTMKVLKNNMTQLNELVLYNMQLTNGLCINEFVKMLPLHVKKLSIKPKELVNNQFLKLLLVDKFLNRMINLQELKFCCADDKFAIDPIFCETISNLLKNRPFLKINIFNKDQKFIINVCGALFEIVMEPIENFVV